MLKKTPGLFEYSSYLLHVKLTNLQPFDVKLSQDYVHQN